MSERPRDRSLLERLLDHPQRVAERLPLPPDARVALTGLVRYAKQLLRARRLRSRSSTR